MDSTTAKFDLMLWTHEEKGELVCLLEYATDLYDPATIARLAEGFLALLDAATADPARPLSRLPLMPAYLDRARELADVLRDVPGVTVLPDPPQTPMLHLLLRTSPEAFVAGARELAEQGLWTWPRPMATGADSTPRATRSSNAVPATCRSP